MSHSIEIHSDELFGQIFDRLVTDMGNNLGDPGCFSHLMGTTLKRRSFSYSIPRYADPYRVKVFRQTEGFLKRYCFQDDEMSKDERNQVTNQKFLANQVRLGRTFFRTTRSDIVVRRARILIRRILGPYVEEEIYPLCRFSRNAVVGYRAETSYLDVKIHKGSVLTGTPNEIAWFENHVVGDPLLADTTLGCKLEPCFALTQSNVPKKFNVDRPVRPNTLIGSFRSYGLGKLVVKKMKAFGINLDHLQTTHRVLACENSRSRKLVTADLSSASDNFQPYLMNMVLPRKWYNALKLGRTPYFSFSGKDKRTYYSPSFMAMGIGFTFPVQSLIFYALIKTICDLLKIRGKVSVFGDDLIYPIKAHNYVSEIFTDLGFILNKDKTFVAECFRESCGGDYFDKIDCRPSSPEVVSKVYKGFSLLALLHKLFNSLTRRWEEVELPITLGFIKNLALTLHDPFLVPHHFPDESGFKSDSPSQKYIYHEGENTFTYGVPCIVSQPSLRRVVDQGIFYWEKLRGEIEVPPIWLKEKYFATDCLIWRMQKERGRPKGFRKMVAYTTKKGIIVHNIGKLRTIV